MIRVQRIRLLRIIALEILRLSAHDTVNLLLRLLPATLGFVVGLLLTTLTSLCRVEMS